MGVVLTSKCFCCSCYYLMTNETNQDASFIWFIWGTKDARIRNWMWWLNVVSRLRVLVPWCFHDKIEIKNSVLPWTIPPEEIKSKNVNYSTVLKSFYWKFQREEDKEIDSKRNTGMYVIEKSNVLTFGGVLNFVCVLWIILDITLF